MHNRHPKSIVQNKLQGKARLVRLFVMSTPVMYKIVFKKKVLGYGFSMIGALKDAAWHM